jgi:DnaJ-class molecular chaperone
MDLREPLGILRTQLKQIKDKRDNVIKFHNEKIKETTKNANSEIAPLLHAISALEQMNTVCESCNGKGEESFTDAAGSRDWRDCRECNGSGVIAENVMELERLNMNDWIDDRKRSECGAFERSGMCKYCDIVTCVFYEEKEEEVDSGG